MTRKTKVVPQYQVWSTLRPAISGGKVVGGTVHCIQYGNTPLDTRAPLPPDTKLEQLHWMQPLIQKVKQPTTKTVAGSAGKTYAVTTYHDGKVTCTCPGYTYRRTCKHIK